MIYSDLPQEFKERILNYEIGVSYFTEIDFDKEKTIFEDVNSSKKVSEWILARNTTDRSADISELESHGIFSYLTDAGLASAVNTKVVAKTFLMLYSYYHLLLLHQKAALLPGQKALYIHKPLQEMF